MDAPKAGASFRGGKLRLKGRGGGAAAPLAGSKRGRGDDAAAGSAGAAPAAVAGNVAGGGAAALSTEDAAAGGAAGAPGGVGSGAPVCAPDRRTASQRAFDAVQASRLDAVAKKMASKSHGEKVEDLNKALAKIPEHFDLFKVALAGQG